jgi:uncharacterized protein
VLLSAYQAKPLLEAQAKGLSRVQSSVDLSITKVWVNLTDDGAGFTGRLITWAELGEIADEERRVFLVLDEAIRPVQVFSEATGWVRTLCPTQTAPTVLVSGIPMHRIKETDPITDTKSKLKALGMPRGKVLDTATGLGYTAIMAARTAAEVVTIELDPAALEIARFNPWSTELFDRKNIRQIVGDAYEEVPALAAGYFDHVIHDPPTMSLGGDLYSEDFYRSLHRGLKRNGRLFHYIGDPNSGLGKRIYPGVMKRLGAAGFHGLRRHEEAYGITAIA